MKGIYVTITINYKSSEIFDLIHVISKWFRVFKTSFLPKNTYFTMPVMEDNRESIYSTSY